MNTPIRSIKKQSQAVTWFVRMKCGRLSLITIKLGNVLSTISLTLLSKCEHKHPMQRNRFTWIGTDAKRNDTSRQMRKNKKGKLNKWPEFQTINYFNISRCACKWHATAHTHIQIHIHVAGPYITLSFVHILCVRIRCAVIDVPNAATTSSSSLPLT